MITILRFILFFLLAPVFAVVVQAAGAVQDDVGFNDKGVYEVSDIPMTKSVFNAAHGEYIEAGFSALGSGGTGWAAARTATGSVAGLSSAYTTPKWHQGSVSASESVATNWSSTRFLGGATNKLPTTRTFQGMEVRAVRDLGHVDDSTLRAMSQHGFAPKTINGDKIVLHHHQQNPAGFIVEVPAPNYSIGNVRQHPFGNQAGAGLTAEQRTAFNQWRVDYWKSRAAEELARSGAQ